MQIDEALLNRASKDGLHTLRFYRWIEPTLSLGYFQKEVVPPKELDGLPIVRRLSGGGAILHHHELTYSLSLGREHPWAQNPTSVYRIVHNLIITVLAEFDFECSLRGEEHSDPTNKTFLCFSRSDENDIVHAGTKVVGSAQRRRRGAVLQHGSILLQKSDFAPELPGVQDLGCDRLCTDVLTTRLEHLITEEFVKSIN